MNVPVSCGWPRNTRPQDQAVPSVFTQGFCGKYLGVFDPVAGGLTSTQIALLGIEPPGDGPVLAPRDLEFLWRPALPGLRGGGDGEPSDA